MIEIDLRPPPVIEDRFLLVDADPVAYFAAFNMDDYPVEAVHKRVDDRLTTIFDTCRVAKGDNNKSALWLTGSTNFRNQICTLKQYKGDRYDKDGNRIKPQPAWLHAAKEYMRSQYNAHTSHMCEADDMLSMSVQHALSRPGIREVMISSVDKDLKINYCMHHNQTTGAITTVKAPGELFLDHRDKPRGSGEMFFYFQMMCGDTTDWIPGLPVVTKRVADHFARRGVTVRAGKCGPKTAYKLLYKAPSAAEAEARVWKCYLDYWMTHGYVHWRDGKAVPAGRRTAEDMFLEQGRLLWMQQSVGELWKPKYIDITEDTWTI